MFSSDLYQKANELLNACKARGWMLATAESCTGGLIAGLLTEIAGSSAVVERGFVTYANAAKTELLGVPESLLAEHGAVSEACARAMAEGALARSPADLAVAVTGIAGPGGGSAEKPVGLVQFATAARGAETRLDRRIFPGDRQAVRLAAVNHALDMLLAAAKA
jgi:nicotinamide-nucleotide amidase